MESDFRPITTLIDQLAMFTADITFVIVFLTFSLIWKEQRVGFIACGFLYLFFTLLWHFYERIALFFINPVIIA